VTLRSRARLAWSLLALYVVTFAAALAFGGLAGRWGDVGWVVIFAAFPVVGALIASRNAGGAVGWICLAIGAGVGATALIEGYAAYALDTHPGSLPGGAYAALFGSFSWVVFIGLIGVYLILFFPDGKLPSPRWRALPWIAAVAMAAAPTAATFWPGRIEGAPTAVENPLGVEGAKPVLIGIFAASVATLFLSILAAVVSIVVRYRRSRGEQRQQLKWFVAAVVFTASLFFLSFPMSLVSDTLTSLLEVASVLAWPTLPVAVGIAILRYRLYDIDVVINRALVFGTLAAFITAVYVAIVVGVSALVGTAGEPNIVLSIVATAVVAVAFQPARARAQRLANRLVYGKRATPYEVLAEFSEQASTVGVTEDLLQKMARAVAEGTGAARSDVWVKSGSELRLAAAWPEPVAIGSRRLTLDNGRLPGFPSADRAVPVRHHEELLGALTIAKPRGESLTPADDRLLNDLAAQAGLVLRNVGLTSELLARLEELRASRQRLVTAQDEERRRLERNLHDGAQQHLVGLKVKLNLAARQAGDTPLEETLVSLQADTDEAIDALRDLARGIYPPLLADQGLAAALDAHARKSPVAVIVDADDLSRYPQEMEAAVYFCCLEALQNVAKYADAEQAVLRLSEEDSELRLSIADDGRGFDPAATGRGSGLQNMADRLEALGGTLEIESAPGAGTRVEGRLPLDEVTPRVVEAISREPQGPRTTRLTG
jgi:signal transduction histidine kinase